MLVFQDVKWVSRLSELPMKLSAMQEERVSYPGSLTHFLQSMESPEVTFELLGIDQIDRLSESHGVVPTLEGISACCRTILWAHQAVPWVYAESWIPEAVIQAHPIVMKGETPLGEWLFKGQPIQRSAFEFAVLSPADALIHRASSKLMYQIISPLIARRRQYTMTNQYSLLVVEVFFEAVCNTFLNVV